MKELVVISGKGGTGKTSMMAALSTLAKNKVLCDADVDASDLHLIMNPKIIETHNFKAGNKPIINKDKCSSCGLCRDICRWNAISENFVIDYIACEGCGVCHYFCPEKAIDFPEKICGKWFVSNSRYGPMVHAQLGIAEENSGKLVTTVRKEANKLALQNGFDLILTDGPPGIGCPVIASIGGSTAVLIVTEPTISAVHDMDRIIKLTQHFKIPAMICINKFDICEEMTGSIEKIASERNIMIAGKIPFDQTVTKSMVNGQTIFEYDSQSEVCSSLCNIWEKIKQLLQITI